MEAQMRIDFILFTEQCATLLGREIHVREALSNNGCNFDRHFTSFSEFVLTLASVNWRISGGRLMLTGTEKISYEIGADQLISFLRLGAAEYELTEKCGPSVFRKTTLEVLSP